MSNKYIEHLWVLPEDDANRQLVNGMEQNLDLDTRRIDVLTPAGGWSNVLAVLTDRSMIHQLESNSKRHLLLLIDFDNHIGQRIQLYQAHKALLQPAVADRVYLLGSMETPERLKAACQWQRLERLGLKLSGDCAPAPATNLWQHGHLQHNASELARLVVNVKPFLF